ncbi:MAG: hypothetical protein K2Q10_12450 [Rhodospirillales bacterium]|nr:hypothetical protein [Rhodospirillales bacterium]
MAALLAMPAVALAQSKAGPTTTPRAPSEMRSMEAIPDQPSLLARQQYEDERQNELKQWQEKIASFTAKARNSNDSNLKRTANELNHTLGATMRNWQSVRQSQSEEWNTQKQAFENTYSRFKEKWQEEVAEGQ